MVLAGALLWSGLMLVTKVTDTIWWSTGGGNVVQGDDTLDTNCTLHLYTADSDINFVWSRQQPPHLTVSHQGWRFSSAKYSVSALQIGTVWLGGGDGTPSTLTLLQDSSITMPLTGPVESLLPSAEQITVKLVDTSVSVKLPHGKLPALLAGLRRCRDSLHKSR